MTRPPLPPDLLRLPIAHRGLHDRGIGRIENSLSAVAAAAAAGYAIEIDVQCSSDGQAVVFHDDTLDRLTGETGAVAARTAAELAGIALTGATDTIPALPQVLSAVAGRVPLLVEIKDRSGTLSETDGRLEAAVASALADYAGPVAVMSFNPHSVARMAALAPGLPRGLTTSAFDPDEWAPVPPATCARLRGMTKFHQHNILDAPPPPGNFDIILCRNLLLYLDTGTRRRVFDRLASALAADGWLMLGAGETVVGQTERFEPAACGSALYRAVQSARGAMGRRATVG